MDATTDDVARIAELRSQVEKITVSLQGLRKLARAPALADILAPFIAEFERRRQILEEAIRPILQMDEAIAILKADEIAHPLDAWTTVDDPVFAQIQRTKANMHIAAALFHPQ